MNALAILDVEPAHGLIAIIISLASPLLGWLVADARSKARLSFMDDKVVCLKADHDKASAGAVLRISELEIRLARSEQDRSEIHRMIERVDSQKASREVVDNFRSELVQIKNDMDKRFDKLERLIEGVGRK